MHEDEDIDLTEISQMYYNQHKAPKPTAIGKRLEHRRVGGERNLLTHLSTIEYLAGLRADHHRAAQSDLISRENGEIDGSKQPAAVPATSLVSSDATQTKFRLRRSL